MRTLRQTNQFRKDLKRVLRGQRGAKAREALEEVIGRLQIDETLEARYYDHALIGDWVDHRDCHIRPDLILIYRKPDPEHLDLVRLGSHSELSL